MKLLYCYILFLDDKGQEKEYRGLHHIELNLSPADRFAYDAAENTLRREKRKAPLPARFWSDDGAEALYSNINNVNVIAGENGSGKTTAIRCVMNLLDYFHEAAYASDRQDHKKTEYAHRALLLLEENGAQYLLDYAPAAWEEVRTKGFLRGRPLVYACRDRQAFDRRQSEPEKAIAELLLKTKVIYLTNTLTQYDYERRIGEKNERLRDFFIYDASIGATIGPEVAQFFPYEVYKQVKYVFDRNQAEKREAIRTRVPELTIPRALRLRPRLDRYRETVSALLSDPETEAGPGKKSDGSTLDRLDLASMLGMLCAAAFAENLGRLVDADLIAEVKKGAEKSGSLQQDMENLIRETERQYYRADLGLKQTGHTDRVTCLAALPNGQAVSGSTDGTLRVWDSATGRCLYVLVGHQEAVTCLAALPNGRVVSGSSDGALRVWDTQTGTCLKTLEGHTAGVKCVAALPNGWVVSGSLDRTLRVWNAVNGKSIKTLRGHSNDVTCVAVFRDGRIVSGSNDRTLRVWDAASGETKQVLRGHKNRIKCAAVLETGRSVRVISGSTDNTLRVWDADTGRCVKIMEGHNKAVRCVTVLRDGRVVSGSGDCTIRVWNADSGQCTDVLKDHSDGISSLAAISDERIVSGSFDHTVRVWDLSSGKRLNTFSEHSDAVNCVSVLPDGNIVSGGQDNCVVFWKTEEQMRALKPFGRQLMQNCLDYLTLLRKERESLFSRFVRINDSAFELSLEAMEKTDGLYQKLTDFIQKYRYTCEPAYTVDFDWGLSSGEENMLRIFSNLYHIFDRDYSSGKYGDYKIYNNEAHIVGYDGKKECDTVLLFMDEADLTLHPEWQRRLIAILTAFIPRIYPASCVKDIQLILSTHSPLLLGDIPSENITYLFSGKSAGERAEQSCQPPGETFGQNIHSILKENFFLGKGTVGDFAAGKINRAAKRLAEIKAWAKGDAEGKAPYEGEMDGIRRIVDLVAPGVLRTKLELLFKEAEDEWTKKTGKRNGKNAQAPNAMNREQLLQALRGLTAEDRESLLKDLDGGGASND